MPKKGAALCIITTQSLSHVLLVKRRDVPVWVLPGGGIDDGETPHDAACRELFEETGLQLKELFHIATLTKGSCLTETTHIFASIASQAQATQNQGINRCPLETEDAKFFSLSELPTTIFPIHERWIQELIQLIPQYSHQKTKPLERPITEVTLRWILLTLLRHPILVTRFALTRITLFLRSLRKQ